MCGAALMLLVLSACQVQIAADINVTENGSGQVTVVVTADAATLRAAPELVDSLQLDDLRDTGWTATVQNPTADGGAGVTLVHDFNSPNEATVLLTELSGPRGPLRDFVLERTGRTNDSMFTFTGVGGLPDGTSGFADSEALVALGAAPFAATIEGLGVRLTDVLQVSVRLTLPGEPLDTNGTLAARENDDLVSTFGWQVPVDGSELTLSASTRDRDVSAMIAGWIARAVFAVMILAAALALIYIATVVSRRTRSTPSS
jgi:hypothetical protein